MDDKKQKGRLPLGDDHWTHKHPEYKKLGVECSNAKLTESEVVEIKRRLRKGECQKYLAREFGIQASTMCDIAHNRTWKHVA